MKKLKICLLIIGILLVALICVNITNNDAKNKSTTEEDGKQIQVRKENMSDVLNNGGSVLEYNGYIYYINTKRTANEGFSNKICRRSIKEGSKEEVINDIEQYSLHDRLMIFNNNLFFGFVGQTYYTNLDNLNYTKKYNEGTLYNIQNGHMLYGDSHNIYRAEYYNSTLAIKNIKLVATVTSTFMFEDEKNLYFYNNNDDGSISIFKVDKEVQNMQILERIKPNNGKGIKILDYEISSKYLYIVLKYVGGENRYAILKINKTLKEESKLIQIDSEIGTYIFTMGDDLYFTLADDLQLYQYDKKKNEIKKVERNKKMPDKYELKIVDKNVELYKNDELFTTILSENENQIVTKSIDVVGEYAYIKFNLMSKEDENKIKEFMFYRVKLDGSNLERLNNTF